MATYSCLLCLSILDKDVRPPPADKFSIKAQIVRLYDLLVPQHRTSSPHQTIIAQIEDSDGFKLCQTCFLSAKEIEKIKQQLSQLEDEIARKLEGLRKTVSNSFLKDEKIGESLQKIRKSLLSSTDQETDQILPDFKVKQEPEDDSFLINNYDEQFLPIQDDIPCPSPTPSNQSDDKDDPLFRLDEAGNISDSADDDDSTSSEGESDESDFYITPDNAKKAKKQPTKSTVKSDPDDKSSPPPKKKRIRIRKYVPKPKKFNESSYKFSCGACLSKFRREKHLRIHLRQEHPGFCQFQCQICQNKYETQGLLDAHMIVRHETEEKSFFCTKPECRKGFTLEVNFVSHMERHKLEKSKPIVCTICDARFANQTYLEKHNPVHMTWICNFCGITLAAKKSWQRHVRTHTGEKPVKCDQCEESFIDKATKNEHMIRHHTSEQHNCSVCGKGFPLKRSLVLHVRKVHENQKSYECSTCGEKFKTGASLKAHNIRDHNAEPIVCDECGATFTGLSGLRMHKIVHSGIRKHECHICGTRFFNGKGLKTHLTSHSDVRNHICHTCGAGFKTKINLDRHLTKVHKLTLEKMRTVGGLKRPRAKTNQTGRRKVMPTENEMMNVARSSNFNFTML
ncbi:gastrula zinc finger protein XlCGF58.1 isoform X2 [Folsomia candida]|uniref:gastrula zinc finger protein XlCGF58.1 isoform X2 n=1 Tax=Folsomia candida TaxID=158441 RepID=UPI000B8F5CA4|nr:gastrula zinc finger protein XlCGF58.1 isoform X2 [Folsomia candida]